MDEVIVKLIGSVGIAIEIVGFLFILWFWRVPTYKALNKWKKMQKIFKFFFGKKRYEKRMSDKVDYPNEEEEIRAGRLLIEGNPMVPRDFIPFWDRMKWFGFVLVLIGLASQIVQNWL